MWSNIFSLLHWNKNVLILKTLQDFFRNWLNSLPAVCVFWLQKLRLDNVQLEFQGRHISQKLYFKSWTFILYTNVGKMFENVCSDTQYFIIYGDTQMTEECIERGGTRSVPYDQKDFSACFVTIFAQWDSSNPLIDVYSHSGSNNQHLLPFFYLLYRRKRQYQYLIFFILLPTRCLAF